jgi:cell wall-associated NlpC family hydrolase
LFRGARERKEKRIKYKSTSAVIILLLGFAIFTLLLSTNASAHSKQEIERGVSALEASSSITIQNEHLIIEIDNNGQYRGWTAAGDAIFYPYDGVPWSSFMSIKIGDTIYHNAPHTSTNNLDDYLTQGTQKLSPTEAETKWYLPGENIEITQDIILVGEQAKFILKLKNNGASATSSSVRYQWDTQIADNDGAPLREEGGDLHEFEIGFEPVTFNYWSAYARPEPGSLVIYATWDNTPNEIIFAHWPEAYYTLYDYSWDLNRRFYTPGYTTSPQSDSCVLMYWKDIPLSPNEEKSIVAYYGTTVGGGVNVDISTDKSSYAPGESVTITAKVTDAEGNCLYPLQENNFKVSLDGSEVHLYDRRIEDAIVWAENWSDGPPYPEGGPNSHRNPPYCERCLAFVLDAYKYGASTDPRANMDPVDYEYAKRTADALNAKDNPSAPPRGAYAFYDRWQTIDGEYKNWGHVGLSLGNGKIVHAYHYCGSDISVIVSDDYRNIAGCTYIGWAWSPITPPITVFERVSCTEYKLKIKAPETTGDYSITVTATTATGWGSDSVGIKVYTIDNVYLTVEGNRLTQYENSADTPIYYRGDSNIYPIFYIDVEVNGATLSEIKDNIQVFANISDYTKVKDSVNKPATYDSGISKYKTDWKNSPNDYPVGKYNVTVEVKDLDGNLLASSQKKHFYLIFKPPAGYEGYISSGTSTYNQFDYQLWKPILDEITGNTNVEDAAKTLLLFAHGIDGSDYGYWHMMMDETKSYTEQYGYPDPTHKGEGYYGDERLSGDYDAYGGLIIGFAEPSPCPRIHKRIQNAWWKNGKNMIDFIESDFDPEGKATHKRPTGVCDDYATLFVSNARSAGIPAIEITGMFREPGLLFGPGHEWAEIFDGNRWVHCEPTWYQIDSLYDGIRILYDASDVYNNERGFYGYYRFGYPSLPERYMYKLGVSIEFDSDDYNYGDEVSADITLKNIGKIDIKRELHFKVFDKPTIVELGPTRLLTDIYVSGPSDPLNVSEEKTYNIQYQLPDYGPLNGFYEWLGDRYLVVQPYFKGVEIIKTDKNCFDKKRLI